MKKKSKKISMVIGTAALAVSLTALPALASTPRNPGQGNGSQTMNNHGTTGYASMVKGALDSLVKAGTLTSDQENTILS
jgi:hypothetical protein